MKHSEYIPIVKSYGVNALKSGLIKVAVKYLPFFATGPLNFLLGKLATKIAEEIAEEGEIGVFFLYVDFRTDKQAKDFESAMLENHKAQQSGSDEDKKNAEEKLKAALNKLVSFRK